MMSGFLASDGGRTNFGGFFTPVTYTDTSPFSADTELPTSFRGLSGSPEVYKKLWAAAMLHHKKNQGYATPADPFKNFRAGEPIDVPPHKVALLRLLEKVARVVNLEQKAVEDAIPVDLDESVEDTLLDIAVLAIITSVLRKEG